MKKSLTAAALLLAMCLSLTAALASGGSAGDPLVSLSYLEGSFTQTLNKSILTRLDEADQAVRDAATGGNATLKEQDVLSGSAGLAFTVLGGSVQMSVSGGAVVDATEGREAAPGLLECGHRYIVAEHASASFTVASPAAVVSWEGSGVLTPSVRPDYHAIAGALQSLGLFRGSGSGVGEGFDLYQAPTRGEGLVMFLRLLGEEDDALACTDSHPFADVPAWLDRHVAWAYRQGYSNGVSGTMFDPDSPISAVEYVELLLRALGYSAAGVHDYSTALERALDCGALTGGEYAALSEAPFRRAHVAYLSYYGLDMTIRGTQQTLAQRMVEQGLLTNGQLAAAKAETFRLT